MAHSTVATVTCRALVVGSSVLLAGCLGGERTAQTTTNGPGTRSTTGADDPATGAVTQMGDLILTSPAFEDGEQIPEQYGYDADNVNPPLVIGEVPDEAESLALVVDDPDAKEPAGEIWDHWVVWNIPPDTRDIPEDWDAADATEGTNDYGERGYGGPNPPDGEHHYRFKLFALDTTLDLSGDAGTNALGEAMDGHVIAQTQLEGTYPA